MRSANRIIRAFFARALCFIHISLSIFILWHVKRDFLYLIPIAGAVLLIIEGVVIILLFEGKEPTRYFSPAFCIYVVTIVIVYWFLELENIIKVLSGLMIRDYKITMDDLRGDLVASFKVVWSQLELQIFFALIIFIRWLIPRSNLSHHDLSVLLFKYFAISCDMLDFLSILQDSWLIRNEQLVYWTLGAWTLSTVQFFVFISPKEFSSHISDSLLSVILMDLPFLGVRMAAIFGFGAHNYNSYFFATKNFVMLLLQLFRIKATYSDRSETERDYARRLKDKIGVDKEASKLYTPEEIARRNFYVDKIKHQRHRQRQNNIIQQMISQTAPSSLHNSNDELNYIATTTTTGFDVNQANMITSSPNINETTRSPPRRPRLPRSIESIKMGQQRSQRVNVINSEYDNDPRFITPITPPTRPARSREPSEQKLEYIRNKLARPTDYMPEEYVSPNLAHDSGPRKKRSSRSSRPSRR